MSQPNPTSSRAQRRARREYQRSNSASYPGPSPNDVGFASPLPARWSDVEPTIFPSSVTEWVALPVSPQTPRRREARVRRLEWAEREVGRRRRRRTGLGRSRSRGERDAHVVPIVAAQEVQPRAPASGSGRATDDGVEEVAPVVDLTGPEVVDLTWPEEALDAEEAAYDVPAFHHQHGFYHPVMMGFPYPQNHDFMSTFLALVGAIDPPAPGSWARGAGARGRGRPRTRKRRRKQVKRKQVEGECPICMESLDVGATLWCKYGCGNNVHKSCFGKWQERKHSEGAMVLCIVCRADWE